MEKTFEITNLIMGSEINDGNKSQTDELYVFSNTDKPAFGLGIPSSVKVGAYLQVPELTSIV